ncbi:hypothetical protein HELRODRAFT_89725 [Helobdella robusta]|uniref:H15 domain-containing protein n=1 Tax=Helobdella robusta TaxID=6412 RepID=T1G7G6_HELRO|nr:hypothetical protein HELRODRAFT_89725 [Helobdella robusta]ESN92237.1 hypothetical protein HELRODRAFT_89725 [Helobdella robusta]
MSDEQVEQAPATAPVEEKKKAPKKKAAPKAKKVADHPKYAEMIKDALNALKERGGSSRQAILKYIAQNYTLGNDEKVINSHLKMALKAGVKNGSLKQSKGVGASGSFKIGNGDKEEKETKPKKVLAKRAATTKAVKSPAKKVEAAPRKSPKKVKAAETKKKPKASPVKKTKPAAKPKAASKPPAAKPAKKEVKKSPAKPKAKAAASPAKAKKAAKPAAKPKKAAKK